jgi:hypothetical protein
MKEHALIYELIDDRELHEGYRPCSGKFAFLNNN